MKLLLYCTKAKPILRKLDKYFLGSHTDNYYWKKGETVPYNVNGKIVAECDFEVEEICSEKLDVGVGYDPIFYTETVDDISKKSCLTQFEIKNYLGCRAGGEVVGYAIHIKNLYIFDKPKELSDFTIKRDKTYDDIVCDSCTTFDVDCKQCSHCYDYENVMKAPQNMMKVCEWDIQDNILISIRPEWLCKILNGEKTIEVRKKVLKEMLE